MQPAIASLAVLGITAVVQFALLFLIFTHPAGGWEMNPFVAFLIGGSLFLIPFLLAVTAATRYLSLTETTSGGLAPSVTFGVVGVFFVGMGLLGYGHGTPGFLLLAFASQIIIGIWALLAARRNT
jgi:hypothetical protein